MSDEAKAISTPQEIPSALARDESQGPASLKGSLPKPPMPLSVPKKESGGFANAEEFHPIRLRHCLQGWPPPGPNGFAWQNDRLTYSVGGSGESMIIPTREQWEEFWRVCDEIDVWSWPPRLGDRWVIDGLEWTLVLECRGRAVVSEGQVHGSPEGLYEKLMRLHRTLQSMAGWHHPIAKAD